jgi:hypothetical protein
MAHCEEFSIISLLGSGVNGVGGTEEAHPLSGVLLIHLERPLFAVRRPFKTVY